MQVETRLKVREKRIHIYGLLPIFYNTAEFAYNGVPWDKKIFVSDGVSFKHTYLVAQL
jgi:hypothetical protein